MDYIIHGTLNDCIDYARLIEYQASKAFETKVLRVMDARPSNKKTRGQSKRNASVSTNRYNSLTNRRKVLTKQVPRRQVTK